MMYFTYKSTFARTAEQANDYLKGELAKGRTTYLSVTDETGSIVAWINGNGKNGAEKHHFITVETKPAVKPVETKIDFPAKKVVPSREEVFEDCDEYEDEVPVQTEKPEEAHVKIEETVEAAPEKIEEEETMTKEMLISLINANNANNAKIMDGILSMTTATAPATQIVEKPVEKIVEKTVEVTVENPETIKKLQAAEARIEKAVEAYKALEAEKKSLVEQLAEMQTKMDEMSKALEAAKKSSATWQSNAIKAQNELKNVKTVAPAVVDAPVVVEAPAADETPVADETPAVVEVSDWNEHEGIERFLDKNGVPFAYYGKCCILWTNEEKALLGWQQQQDLLDMIQEHFYRSVAGTPTDAEEFGVTKLIRPEVRTDEEDHDREFEFIWKGPVGQIDTEKLPAFKYRRTVDCSKFGLDRDVDLPATIAYGQDYMDAAEGEDYSTMRNEQRTIDESGDVKQVSYTTLSDGRIAFRMKDGTISYDWYWSPEDYFRNSGCMKGVMKLSRKSGIEVRFCEMMAHARQAQPVHELLDSLEDTNEDRVFLKKYIDRYDIRVARPYTVTAMYSDRSTKDLMTFANFWDVMMFEYTFNNDIDYTAGNAYVDECFMRQLHCKGASDKANWTELAKHIDAAKARLHMADYVGKAV